jgi:hypothetical protein
LEIIPYRKGHGIDLNPRNKNDILDENEEKRSSNNTFVSKNILKSA